MASFLEKLSEIEPIQYKYKIQNSLSTLGKFNILFGVALDEIDETVQRILVENVSADWKRLACYTCLHDIKSIVEQIDRDYSDDQSKMTAFLSKLNELDPLNYKMWIVKFLNDASRFDVLFKLALYESFESTMKFLLERESSDWKTFANYVCLYEVNCIIENIDQKNISNHKKMKALLEKLFDINPLQVIELIKSTLITMKRFSVLSAFEVDGCHGKEKEEKEEKEIVKVNNERNENSPLLNVEPLGINPESGKTAVSIAADHKLAEPKPEPTRCAAFYDYSAADHDEEDQAKESDILDNSEMLLQLKMKIGKDWMNLGRFLSVNVNELDVINAENNDDLEEKAFRMLCAWKNQKKFPTLNALARALYQINRTDLIRMMERFSNKSFETENSQKPSIKEKAEMHETLKKFYLKTYEKMDEIVHNVKTPARVELLNKFIKLILVDADEVEKDIVNTLEQKLFFKRQMAYKSIEFNDVFSKELPLLLISGIAGIGKTCLLRKCLLDWASGTLWEKVDFVLFLECRELNQCQNIGDIKELLTFFYKNIFQECDVCEHFSILFVIDGLDEFAYLDELINHSPQNPSKQPIVKALAEALNTQKHKCVVAGRIGAILQYKDKVTKCADKLNIQIMGFDDQGINEYIKKVGNKKEAINEVLKASFYAKAIASVPFYLSSMCAIIAANDSYSFYTMTELYCCIFLYFFQKHICKTNKAVHRMMQRESNKQHVLRVCKVAWELFNQGKIIFSQEEMKGIIKDFDEVENELLGFIERVESQLGYQYQFAHLTLMEFCVSVHAHIFLSPKKIIKNKKLFNCLPMICGLENENQRGFVKFLANLKNSNEERNSLLNTVLDLVPKDSFRRDENQNYKMFMECFFEAQASMTGDLKKTINERKWGIIIRDGNTAHEVSHENYFMEKLIDAGFQLDEMHVVKNIFSDDEKKLLMLCSTNVRCVCLNHPVKIDGWTPSHKIDSVWIENNRSLVSKNEFEGFVLPWIRLTEKLILFLHDDTNFIDDICEWLCGLKFVRLEIEYRGEHFYNIEKLKKLSQLSHGAIHEEDSQGAHCE